MQLLRYILFPIVPIYYLVTWLRNKLYDIGILGSKEFDIPIICVGNLSTGGTGKSPMTEYLIRLLQPQYNIAVLSRGYKRDSTGFVLATSTSTVEDLGDEPFQIHRKFPDIKLAVDKQRVHGIKRLLNLDQPPELIILDDGFQHRRVKAGLNILLTSYDNLYVNDMVLPTGNLREPISGAKRARIVIVTKCPVGLSDQQMFQIKKQLNKGYDQIFYFSSIGYGQEIINDKVSRPLSDLLKTKFTLVTGIANSTPLVGYLKDLGCEFDHMEFNDHHIFSKDELEVIKQQDLVLTTEKDYVRLTGSVDGDSIYYLPIEHIINDKKSFEKRLLKFCNSYSIGAAEF